MTDLSRPITKRFTRRETTLFPYRGFSKARFHVALLAYTSTAGQMSSVFCLSVCKTATFRQQIGFLNYIRNTESDRQKLPAKESNADHVDEKITQNEVVNTYSKSVNMHGIIYSYCNK